MKLIRGEVFKISPSRRKEWKKREKTVEKPRNQVPNARSDKSKQAKETNMKNCRRFGLKHGTNCPAKWSTCTYCKKKDHWLAVCRKRLHTVNFLDNEDEEDTSEDTVVYIRTVEQEDRTINDKWTVKLNIGNKDVPFRIDTGAKCNILTKVVLESLEIKSKLSPSKKVFKSYTNHKISQIGKIVVQAGYNTTFTEIVFEVVDINQECVISGDIAE